MTKKTIRAPTRDKSGQDTEKISILTVEQLGPNMSKLPNGNLLCANVPIARVGWLMYGPGETPVEVGSEGVAYVQRTADALFSPECVGSIMGVALVTDHPPDDVTPANWKRYAQGFATTNVRRGTGDDADVLLADLIITDKSMIADVLAGKREVSLGYDADYKTVAPGVGMQFNILANHIALVPKGRCGPRCSIGDEEFQPPLVKETAMAKRVKIIPAQRRATLDSLDVLRQKAADAAAELADAEEELEEDEDGDTHIHLHTGSPATGDGGSDPYEDRFAALEASMTQMGDAMAAIAKAVGGKTKTEDADGGGEEEDEEEEVTASSNAAKTTDSAALATSFTQTLAQAEVLVPGFKMPTFDASLDRAKTVDTMCQLRRRVLDAAYVTTPGQALIDGVAGAANLDIAGMDCAAVATLFKAAAGAKAMLNNHQATRDGQAQAAAKPVNMSIAAINEANAKFWEAQQKKV